MPSWTGAAWNVEPRELERVLWWGDSRSDELWTQLVVATVNQGDKVVVPQGNQGSQGVGHVVVPIFGGTYQALMPSWTGAAWNGEPRGLESAAWWWDSEE